MTQPKTAWHGLRLIVYKNVEYPGTMPGMNRFDANEWNPFGEHETEYPFSGEEHG